jgi:hypothetical protein
MNNDDLQFIKKWYDIYKQKFIDIGCDVLTTLDEYIEICKDLSDLRKDLYNKALFTINPHCGENNIHIRKISFNQFKKTPGVCLECSLKINSDQRKKKYDNVKTDFEKTGAQLITTENEYKNMSGLNKCKFKIIAKCNHEMIVKYNDFIYNKKDYQQCEECRKPFVFKSFSEGHMLMLKRNLKI